MSREVSTICCRLCQLGAIFPALMTGGMAERRRDTRQSLLAHIRSSAVSRDRKSTEKSKEIPALKPTRWRKEVNISSQTSIKLPDVSEDNKVCSHVKLKSNLRRQSSRKYKIVKIIWEIFVAKSRILAMNLAEITINMEYLQQQKISIRKKTVNVAHFKNSHHVKYAILSYYFTFPMV